LRNSVWKRFGPAVVLQTASGVDVLVSGAGSRQAQVDLFVPGLWQCLSHRAAAGR
jgi:hypothetical protein